jgi:rare lipoprotein A (peptidoglycan hydrolase)
LDEDYEDLLRTTTVRLGAVLGAIAIGLPTAIAAAGTPASVTGGVVYGDGDPAAVVTPDGSSLSAPMGELLGGELEFSGRLTGTKPGETVEVQRLDARLGWTRATTTVVAEDGSFSATWKTDRAGRTTVRAIPADASTSAVVATVAPAREVAVFRPALATWYGPGFYGRRTACGARMSRSLLGVAHRKLPCGTMVDLLHQGRTIRVPVVDRGPFAHRATYDLTSATAKALGVTTTTRIGTLRVAPPVTAPTPAPPAPAAAPTGATAAP